MDAIRFVCPRGHKIKAAAELAGKMARCPSCQAVMMVPEPIKQLVRSQRQLTESGVVRMLGDVPPLPPAPEKPTHIRRTCPRCRHRLSPAATVCEQCQLYVGLNLAAERP